LEYIGTPINTASGTDHHALRKHRQTKEHLSYVVLTIPVDEDGECAIGGLLARREEMFAMVHGEGLQWRARVKRTAKYLLKPVLANLTVKKSSAQALTSVLWPTDLEV
jgi:hypothetical protein